MNCPNCQVMMSPVKTTSKYGASVFIDQCPSCGGIWFDGDEIYLAQHQETDNYIQLDEKKLIENVVVNQNLLCPRDGQSLSVFSDPYFSKEINIECCKKCGGFWFNRGEFATFQNNRKKTIEKNDVAKNIVIKNDTELSKSLDRLMLSSASDNYGSWASLGRHLSQPVNYGDLHFQKNLGVSNLVGASQIILLLLKIIMAVLKK